MYIYYKIKFLIKNIYIFFLKTSFLYKYKKLIFNIYI